MTGTSATIALQCDSFLVRGYRGISGDGDAHFLTISLNSTRYIYYGF